MADLSSNHVDRMPIWARGRDGRPAFSEVGMRDGGRMPDFCVIGAAKAATTTLNAMLALHPNLFMCPIKEPHYFSTDVVRARGEQWYRGLYADAKADQLCGEASTSYARLPMTEGTAARMAQANPGMKLIYLLREPVARTESECLQTMKYCRNILGRDLSHLSLDQLLDVFEDPGSEFYTAPIATSEYIRQIAPFDVAFPSNQMLFLLQDDLRTDTKGTLQRVFEFLDVAAEAEIDIGSSRNVTANFMAGLRDERLTSHLRALPFYEAARKLLPQRLRNTIKRAVPKPDYALSEDRRAALAAHFAPHNRRLAERIGRDLPGWDMAQG